MPSLSGAANRVEVTRSCRPNVIKVGAWMAASAAVASCASTAPDWRMKASTGGIGRPRTNSARASTYSGRAAYISGVKHQGKMPWMIISGTLARASLGSKHGFGSAYRGKGDQIRGDSGGARLGAGRPLLGLSQIDPIID